MKHPFTEKFALQNKSLVGKWIHIDFEKKMNFTVFFFQRVCNKIYANKVISFKYNNFSLLISLFSELQILLHNPVRAFEWSEAYLWSEVISNNTTKYLCNLTKIEKKTHRKKL